MWSGPRNLSTAMMRSWENRDDTAVWDEPFYAYYLAKTQRPDPLADVIMQAGETEWQAVVNTLSTPPLQGLHYHKHITSHILADDSLDWLSATPGMRHVFLIREPQRVVASFNKLLNADDEDKLTDFIGVFQQHRIFQFVTESTGADPIVIDSTRFLQNPAAQLQTLCARLNIEFQEAMLSWPAGPRESDGIWAPHWYHSVHSTTGFGAAPTALPTLNEAMSRVAARCEAPYQTLLKKANKGCNTKHRLAHP